MNAILKYVYLFLVISYSLLAIMHYMEFPIKKRSIKKFLSEKQSTRKILLSLLRIDLAKKFWNEQSKLLKILFFCLGAYIFFALIFSAYIVSVQKNGVYINFNVIFFTILFPLIVSILIYYPVIFGWNLLSNVIDTINNIKLRNKSRDAILNFFIPFLFLVYLLSPFVYDSQFLYIILLSISLIGHFVTLRAMFIIAHDASYLHIPNVKNPTVSKYAVSLVWLLILLMNLYCETLLINRILSDSYPNSSSLDLLFMTLSSFFTVDIGDLPNNWASKFENLLIVITSVYFIAIVIASVVSKEIKPKGKNRLHGYKKDSNEKKVNRIIRKRSRHSFRLL